MIVIEYKLKQNNINWQQLTKQLELVNLSGIKLLDTGWTIKGLINTTSISIVGS